MIPCNSYPKSVNSTPQTPPRSTAKSFVSKPTPNILKSSDMSHLPATETCPEKPLPPAQGTHSIQDTWGRQGVSAEQDTSCDHNTRCEQDTHGTHGAHVEEDTLFDPSTPSQLETTAEPETPAQQETPAEPIQPQSQSSRNVFCLHTLRILQPVVRDELTRE